MLRRLQSALLFSLGATLVLSAFQLAKPALAAQSPGPGWIPAAPVTSGCSNGDCSGNVGDVIAGLYEYYPDRQTVSTDYSSTDLSEHGGYPTYVRRQRCSTSDGSSGGWSAGSWHHAATWQLIDGVWYDSNHHWVFLHSDTCVPNTPTPTNTPTLRPTNTPLPTNTPGPSPTSRPTRTPLPTITPRPTSTPGPSPTPLPTFTPLPTATATRTPGPTNTPAPTFTPGPTNTPAPTTTPVVIPTPPALNPDIRLYIHSRYDGANIYRTDGGAITWPQAEILDWTPYIDPQVPTAPPGYTFNARVVAWSYASTVVNGTERRADANDDRAPTAGCRSTRRTPVGVDAVDAQGMRGCVYRYTQTPNMHDMERWQAHTYWSMYLPTTDIDDNVYIYKLAELKPAQLNLQVRVKVTVLDSLGNEVASQFQNFTQSVTVNLVTPRSTR